MLVLRVLSLPKKATEGSYPPENPKNEEPMPSLVIVESPAKAKTIANFLGKNYRVEASYGHVRDLPAGKKDVPEEYKSEAWADFAVNVEDKFQPIYIVTPEKRKQIAALKKALQGADELLLATDEDREGESISWHLVEVLKPKVPVRRIVFHEITREAIKEAVANPRDIDQNLVYAQEGRRIVDRLFGYKLSPMLWRKVQPGLSAGRVQSVAVRVIVEREEERRAFVSSEYWDLEAQIDGGTGIFKAVLDSLGGKKIASGKDFDASTGKLKSKNVVHLLEKDAASLAGIVSSALPWRVSSVEEKPATQRPYAPFTTSTLQQEANRKLGYTARRTMQIAQRLYEGVELEGGESVGLITYMRTDSTTLSEKALGDAQRVIRDIYGAEYAKGPKQYKTKSRNAQEAHEAIRPTELGRRPQDVKRFLAADELALYELIWKRTIASQMPDAQLLRTIVTISADADKQGEATFTTSGKKILFPGFLRAYVEGSDDPGAELGDQEVILPDLKVGTLVYAKGKAKSKDDVQLAELLTKRHETAPPPRYTEASLVKKLEEEGIGRPSTYASIISTIQDRGYVILNKSKQLVPTFTAMVTTNLLREHFAAYVDLKFTARMEEELDQIAEGSLSMVDAVSAFYRGDKSTPGLEKLVEGKQKTVSIPEIPLGKDPKSGENVVIRVGKYGPYLLRGELGEGTIADVPADIPPAELKLDDALKILEAKAEGPRNLGTDPATGLTVYVNVGRYGPYVQLGETPEAKSKEKPRRASLEKGQTPDTISLKDALKLLEFPKTLGKHPETGKPIIANKGKFGPYVQHDSDFRSIKKDDTLEGMTYERALELLAEPKAPRRGATKEVLKDFGGGIQALDGRYGAYVTNGKVNATIDKDVDPTSLTKEQAEKLLAEKGKTAGKKPARGRASKKK